MFLNADGVAHTVTEGTAAKAQRGPDDFDSGEVGPGESFEVTFDQAGTYTFFCTLHPQMTGRVVVGT